MTFHYPPEENQSICMGSPCNSRDKFKLEMRFAYTTDKRLRETEFVSFLFIFSDSFVVLIIFQVQEMQVSELSVCLFVSNIDPAKLLLLMCNFSQLLVQGLLLWAVFFLLPLSQLFCIIFLQHGLKQTRYLKMIKS